MTVTQLKYASVTISHNDNIPIITRIRLECTYHNLTTETHDFVLTLNYAMVKYNGQQNGKVLETSNINII